MKPFNLERAMAGDPVVTRDGEPVTQLHVFNASNAEYPMFGVVDEVVLNWTEEGIRYVGASSPNDLFMAPKIQKRWVTISSEDEVLNKIHNSEAGALLDKQWHEEQGWTSRIIPIEWSE